MRIKQLVPMLSVSDLARTMAFYCDELGFQCTGTFGDPSPVWCHLERDGVALMFNQPPAEAMVELPLRAKDFQVYYCYPDDVAALHLAWKQKGLPVTDLRVTVYGMKEFELRDPDGYWLWFGQGTAEPPTVRE
ncbi:MAG: bleomycin resistance protein [Bacteroidota bacterium]|jgi:catechol 2,3-dioxygenase-like lactoylglutathione lyase family enzyme